jgi:hypothetical protein
MLIKTLYRKSGAYSYSLTQDAGAIESGLVRLIADEGMALTNGADTASAIDVTESDAMVWTEIPLPPADTDPESVVAELEGLLA